MTITRISPGVWELRTRHGTLIGTGDLYTIVTLWARMRRDGWSEISYGQQRTLDSRPSIECTGCHDCRCRACTSPAAAREPVATTAARVLRTQVIAPSRSEVWAALKPTAPDGRYQADENPAAPSSERHDEIALGAAVRRASGSSA